MARPRLPVRRILLAYAVLIALGAPAFYVMGRHGLGGFWPSGDIASGSAFGIRIGDDVAAAKARLATDGAAFVEEGYGRACAGATFAGDEMVSFHLTSSQPRRMTCLGSRQSKVTRIVWRRFFLTPP